MTRGYFVLEMKGLLHAAALMSDAYLEGYGKEIIEAFLNNNEERLLDTLRAKMNEKDRTEMDRYICPEWYRITKKSEAKDYIAEYGYVISAEKLKIYNNGKLLITMDKITAKEWLYLIDHGVIGKLLQRRKTKWLTSEEAANGVRKCRSRLAQTLDTGDGIN